MKKPQVYLKFTAERTHEWEFRLCRELTTWETCHHCSLEIPPFSRCWWDWENPNRFYHFGCVDLSWSLVDPNLKDLVKETLCDSK